MCHFDSINSNMFMRHFISKITFFTLGNFETLRKIVFFEIGDLYVKIIQNLRKSTGYWNEYIILS